MVRAGRMPGPGGARPADGAPVPRLSPDPRLRPADRRPQDRGRAVLRPISPPARRPAPGRRRRDPDPEGAAPTPAHAQAGRDRSSCSMVSRTRTSQIYARSATGRSSSCCTARACAVSECCGLEAGDVDDRRATVTVLGKGAKVRRLPLGEPALAGRPAVRATKVVPALAHDTVRGGAVPERPRATHDATRRPAGARSGIPLPDGRVLHPHSLRHAYRHAPARRGRRSQSGSGAARTRRCGNHADLHSRHP